MYFTKHNSWISPTLFVLQGLTQVGDLGFSSDALYKNESCHKNKNNTLSNIEQRLEEG